MGISLSSEKTGKVGLAGHIGVSHAHSHSSFVQEDGAVPSHWWFTGTVCVPCLIHLGSRSLRNYAL